MASQQINAPASEARSGAYWQRFAVSFEFPVVFTRALFAPENRTLADAIARLEPDRRHRCLVFLDAGLAPELAARIEAYAAHHAARIELVAPPQTMPGGEKIKNELAYVEQMQGQVFQHRIDRHSYIIAVGGGALLDVVGLVAATSHRGIRHIRVPTTVLSQNDSGVGVKNGVNLNAVKNFVGTFAPPFAVLNDFDLLASLPPREKIAGMAEAVKVALIRDPAFFLWLERHADALAAFEPDAMATMIRRCAELHMHQIAHGGDPFESGSARPLDFGHWSAHKLESLTRYHLRHGEAVAIGIALDSRYSVSAGMLAQGADDRVCFLLENLGFKLWHPALRMRGADQRPAILQGLREFREHLGGEFTVTLLTGLGEGVEVHELDEAMMMTAIDWLEARSKS
ncbi:MULTISPECIES: 3-dehydroquinate synthase [Rhodomicrobium]|uniref:3-dehydroquinate synthase n=1 Tax=Rhodomicrobium TaxID=1068 RepID=UPI000B4C0037|nr:MULTISPECIES: 3-dehydroquinate synthase [Rhodomicrobium]